MECTLTGNVRDCTKRSLNCFDDKYFCTRESTFLAKKGICILVSKFVYCLLLKSIQKWIVIAKVKLHGESQRREKNSKTLYLFMKLSFFVAAAA